MKTLVHSTAGDLKSGDLVRGINHSRIVTGPPVRVIRLRVPDVRNAPDVIRISYFILGRNEFGWRDVPCDRGVTVEVDA